MEPAPKTRVSVEEYLDLEGRSETKHEYVDGEMVAMAGASPEHNLVAGNFFRALADRLSGRCLTFQSDQRILVTATRLYAYPDVSVVCQRPVRDAKDRLSIVNPALIVEVLSPETEAYDRGAKFAHYRTIASLHTYLLVSFSERRVEYYLRGEAGAWILTEFLGQSVVTLPAVGIELPLQDVYRDLELLAEP